MRYIYIDEIMTVCVYKYIHENRTVCVYMYIHENMHKCLAIRLCTCTENIYTGLII